MTQLCRRHASQSIDSLRPLLFDADEVNELELRQELPSEFGVIRWPKYKGYVTCQIN